MQRLASLVGSARIHGFAHEFVEPEKTIKIPKELVNHQDRLKMLVEKIRSSSS